MADEVRQVRLTPASEIRSARQRWLWDGTIPLGSIALFAGRGGEGKSSFALHLAAQLNAGTLEGDLHGEPHPVLIAAIEDDWATVMKPRLVAAGASLPLVYRLSIESTLDKITRETVPALPLDVDLIKAAIIGTGAKMVILDPATSLMSGDMNKREDVRRSLDGLLTVAQETGCTFVLIVHFSKGTGLVSEKISGSHALRDAARSVLLFATDDDTGNRIVSLDKNSYSRNASSSFAFQLVDTAVRTDDGEVTHVARVANLETSDLSVSEIVNRDRDTDDTDRGDAERWLISYLAETGGTAPARDVKKASAIDGLEWRTVQRASQKVTDKSKSGFQGAWVWTLDLDKGASKGAKGDHAPEPDAFGTFAENVTPFPATHPHLTEGTTTSTKETR